MQSLQAIECRETLEDLDPQLTLVAQRMLRDLLAGHTAETLAASARWPHSLRHQLRTLAEVAQQDCVPVERLLVSIKRAWQSVPRARLSLGDNAGDILTAVVTVCIEEYFADAEHARHA